MQISGADLKIRTMSEPHCVKDPFLQNSSRRGVQNSIDASASRKYSGVVIKYHIRFKTSCLCDKEQHSSQLSKYRFLKNSASADVNSLSRSCEINQDISHVKSCSLRNAPSNLVLREQSAEFSRQLSRWWSGNRELLMCVGLPALVGFSSIHVCSMPNGKGAVRTPAMHDSLLSLHSPPIWPGTCPDTWVTFQPSPKSVPPAGRGAELAGRRQQCGPRPAITTQLNVSPLFNSFALLASHSLNVLNRMKLKKNKINMLK